MQDSDYINAGEISGVFSIKGWVKVFSFTQPRENILNYTPWYVQNGTELRCYKLVGGQRQGNNVVAALEGINDRDVAAKLSGARILIQKTQLPKPQEGEYYWADLIGLAVRNEQDVVLGVVDHLLETGANDVLVVVDGEIERLIPFLQDHTIKSIDLQQRLMVVDWDPDF